MLIVYTNVGYHFRSIVCFGWSRLNLHHVLSKRLKSFQQTWLQSRGDSEAGVPQDQGPQIPIPWFWRTLNLLFLAFRQFIWGRSSQFAESPDSCDQIVWECEKHPCCFQDFSASVGGETSRKVPSEVSSSKRRSMSLAHPDHPASFASKCVAQIFVCNFYMLFAPHFSITFQAYCHTQNYLNWILRMVVHMLTDLKFAWDYRQTQTQRVQLQRRP